LTIKLRFKEKNYFFSGLAFPFLLLLGFAESPLFFLGSAFFGSDFGLTSAGFSASFSF
jgi:hypothetical protein